MRKASKVDEAALRDKAIAWLRSKGYRVEAGKQLLVSKIDIYAVKDGEKLAVQVLGDAEEYRQGMQVLLAAKAELGDVTCMLLLPTVTQKVREVADKLGIRVIAMDEIGVRESEVAETRLSDTKLKVLAAIYCCEKEGKDAYGYAIWRVLRKSFNMFKDFEDMGNIYRHLDELERMKYIKLTEVTATGKARKIYKLTAKARQLLEEHGMPYVEKIISAGGRG
ncbi:MAG: hypothetical protein DRJ31_03300 [Candidatus Methanomethylicota archaeon]|uniref:Transcription regulator PadR N-terminal domain-containing protein n=2 Tax=Thermoproteota archaeon TaxID=2056631 RepID=A0A497ERA5_9CREN|nr:MAG: hypothetical protein DRJ31_03300 [Candidatus Verstraetearchaeota archaeon]